MKRSLFLFFCLTLAYSTFAQKLIQGTLDFLKYKDSVIEVKWDISQTEFSSGGTLVDFLSPDVTIEEWDNELLPNAINAFIINNNNRASDYGLTFSLQNDAAQYEMIVAPQTLKKKTKCNTKYTIRKKETGETMAVFENIVSGSSPISLLIDIFDVAGNNMGNFFMKFFKTSIKNEDNKVIPKIVKTDMKTVKTYLRHVKVLNYRFDFSEAIIDGVEIKEYVSSSDEEAMDNPDEEFRKYAKKVEYAFILSANKNAFLKKGYKLDNKDDLPFEVVIYPMDIDEDGEHNILGVIVAKADNKEIAGIRVHADSGGFNAPLILFLEQLEVSGERFGSKLANDILDKARGK